MDAIKWEPWPGKALAQEQVDRLVREAQHNGFGIDWTMTGDTVVLFAIDDVDGSVEVYHCLVRSMARITP